MNFAKYFAKYSGQFLLTFKSLERDRNYLKNMPKRNAQVISLFLCIYFFPSGFSSTTIHESQTVGEVGS